MQDVGLGKRPFTCFNSPPFAPVFSLKAYSHDKNFCNVFWELYGPTETLVKAGDEEVAVVDMCRLSNEGWSHPVQLQVLSHHGCVGTGAAFGPQMSSDWRTAGLFGLELALLPKCVICLCAVFSNERDTRKHSKGNMFYNSCLMQSSLYSSSPDWSSVPKKGGHSHPAVSWSERGSCFHTMQGLSPSKGRQWQLDHHMDGSQSHWQFWCREEE